MAECATAPGCWSRGHTEEEATEAVRALVREFLTQRDQLLSQGFYPMLADEIVSWYSRDASWWRESGLVSSPPGEAIGVLFRFEGEVPYHGAELLDQIAARLKAPYTTDEWDRAATIVMATSEEEAEMEVLLSEEMDNGDLCLRHDQRSKKLQCVVSIGHFPLLSSAWQPRV
jgi:hypothetical protein